LHAISKGWAHTQVFAQNRRKWARPFTGRFSYNILHKTVWQKKALSHEVKRNQSFLPEQLIGVSDVEGLMALCATLACVVSVFVSLQTKGRYQVSVKALGNFLGNFSGNTYTLMTDPIADMINRLKNARMVGKESTTCPYSKLRHAIAEKLQKKGVLKSVSIRGEGVHRHLDMEFARAADGAYSFSGVRRVSKPGCRVYTGAGEIRPVKGGRGFALLSTPKGILFHYEARKEHVGGELLCEIW